METAISADGTPIAYDRLGSGPALLLINGGPVDRMANADLAELLSADFTVYNHDRRGRGDSGDTQPFTVDREFEDLQAVLDAAGGEAAVYGTSGGGIIALQAAARGLNLTRAVLWEPPYILPGTRPPVPADYRERLTELLAAGRLGDMVELFFTAAVGMPAEFVAPMRHSPFWPAMEKLAPALVYDATLTGDFSVPVELLALVSTPTLVVDGGTTPWLTASADATARALPHARRETLTGQAHNVDAAAIAPVVRDHLTA